MDSLSHQSPRAAASLPVTLLVVAFVLLLLLLEYAFDWPIHLRSGTG